MSHYFQQLLTSSGLVQPVAMAPSGPPGPGASAAALAEINEESPAASPASFSSSPTGIIPEVQGTPADRENRLAPAAHPAPAAARSEPGIVEIVSHRIEASDIHAMAATPSAAVSGATPPAALLSVSPAPVSPGRETIVEQVTPSPAVDSIPVATVLREPSDASSAPAPAGVPSSDELIQHVFRWVGQNPPNLYPPALSSYAQAASQKLQPAESPSAKPSPTPAAGSLTAALEIVNSPATPPAPLIPPVARAQQPDSPPVAVESSVEISIGTLQILVEAPPAPAPKPARRPTAPRTLSGASPAPAVRRPTIDINRLRRGFYL